MHERIARLIDDRTRMLAAISHDLRTPITRLRLRAELVEDEGHRKRMLIDLDQMRSMLESVLSLLRNDRKIEAMTLFDIASTRQLDHRPVRRHGPQASPTRARCFGYGDARGRPTCIGASPTSSTTRCGSAAKRRSASTSRYRSLVVDVEDDGPGISDARKQSMLEPFVRGDEARNMDEATGFGLGLSIARAIALAHGGEAVVARPRRRTG